MNIPKKAQWAQIFCNEQFIHIGTLSGYRSQRADYDGKNLLLPVNASDEMIGDSLFSALAESRFLRPEEHPTFFDSRAYGIPLYEEWVQSLLVKYLYKNRRALFKKMICCNVEYADNILTIAPSHHERLEAWSGDGITSADSVIICEQHVVSHVGAAVRLALSRCT
jgi:hypothetical protein